MIIKECISPQDILATFPIMRQLRSNIEDAQDYLQLIQNLRKTEHYRLISLLDNDDHCLAVSGFRIKHSLFSAGKKEMYIDDLVTDAAHRSRSFGKQMFVWLKSESRRLGCVAITLDSGIQRTEAHKFYGREGMKITSFHFSLMLNDT